MVFLKLSIMLCVYSLNTLAVFGSKTVCCSKFILNENIFHVLEEF